MALYCSAPHRRDLDLDQAAGDERGADVLLQAQQPLVLG